MINKIRAAGKFLIGSIFLVLSMSAFAQPYTYKLFVTNEVAISANIYQFDIFILNTSTGVNPLLELSGIQFGLGFDTNIVNGGTLTPFYVPGSTEFNAAQSPVTISFSGAGSIQQSGGITYRFFDLAGRTPPGPTHGTLISNVDTSCIHPGTRVGTFTLTNSNPFTPGVTPKHRFTIQAAMGIANTLVTIYEPPNTLGATNTNITDTLFHLAYQNPGTCDQNIVLNSNCSVTASATTTPVSCSGGSNGTATITISGLPAPPTSNGIYMLDSGSVTPFTGNPFTITGLTAGTHSIIATTSTPCSTPAFGFTVSTSATPCISPGSTTTFCTGDSVILTAMSSSSYSWSNGATTQSITVTTSGAYSVTLDSNNTSSPIDVTVHSLPSDSITANGPTTFCNGGQVTLVADTGILYLYSWSSGESTQGITVSTPGNYSVTVTDTNGCSATSTVIDVIVNPVPVDSVSANGPASFCEGGQVVLTSDTAHTYLWNSGDTTQGITVSTSGNYSVTVTNVYGCTAVSTPLQITVHPLPSLFLGNDTSIATGTFLVLDAGSGFTFYNWSTGETTQSIQVSISSSYSVVVTDQYQCTNSDTIQVAFLTGIKEQVQEMPAMIYPNPSLGKVTISTPFKNSTIRICDMQGRMMLEQKIMTGSTSITLPPGIYFVTLNAENGITEVRKIVIL